MIMAIWPEISIWPLSIWPENDLGIYANWMTMIFMAINIRGISTLNGSPELGIPSDKVDRTMSCTSVDNKCWNVTGQFP